MMEWMPRGLASRFRCKERDVLEAFRATGQGIRSRLRRFSENQNPPLEAALIADRVREQRELVRQIIARRHWQRVRTLLRINSKTRERFVARMEQAGIADPAYALRCKYSAGRVPSSKES